MSIFKDWTLKVLKIKGVCDERKGFAYAHFYFITEDKTMENDKFKDLSEKQKRQKLKSATEEQPSLMEKSLKAQQDL